MSQHQSLKVDSVGAKHRNVLSRIERIKKLQELKRWNDKTSAFNLPKHKSLKIKVKKAAKVKEGAEGAAAAPAAGAAAAAPAAKKPAAPAGKK